MEYKELLFGVELEFTGITRSNAASILSTYFNSESWHEGSHYDIYSIQDNKNRAWKISCDSSIASQKKLGNSIVAASDEHKVELISPPLNYEDIELLQELVRQLRHKGMIVNQSTGIHVHVGVDDLFDAKHLRFLCNIIYSKQNLIYKSLQVHNNRVSYCNKLSNDFIERLNKKKPNTIEEFKDVWYQGYSDRTSRYNSSRYHILNLHNLLSNRQPTIEIRAFNSSTHAGQIKSYVQWSLLVVAQALNAKSAIARETVATTGNDNYTFRVWLLKLGMIGDEFKTARLHLLKNLQGNTAWRDRV